ncbi:MAG: zinc metalloprotease [Actinomycetota bacterium]|nr:zinc metalloprotease [Actinomycetota bacterium]
MLRTRIERRAAAGLVALAAALPLTAMTGTAYAMPSGAVGTAATCLPGTASLKSVPVWRRHPDTTTVSLAQQAALQKLVTRPTTRTRSEAASPDSVSAATTLPRSVIINVYVHVIEGTHAGEKSVGGPQVYHLVKILDGGFNHAQSTTSADTRYSFRLMSARYTINDRWYHAAPLSADDLAERRALHRGTADDLNIYLSRPKSSDGPTLGFSRFPWQYAGNPGLDGVTVSIDSMPGGRASGYNHGDTVIHETGHWMGLLHTFEGGCSSPNDGVSDTPEEASANYYCPTRPSNYKPSTTWASQPYDTCAAPGLDPIHNFMDYSYDTCMHRFTPDQVVRMDAMFTRYRYRR